MHGTSRQVLPSYLEVRRALKAFYAAAEEKGLGRRRRQIYRSWIIGFLCWCSARPPHRARSDRIRPFLRSIQQHPDSESTHEVQATKALNFLFDAVWPHVDEELSLFTTGIYRSEDDSSPPTSETSTPDTGEGQNPASESKVGSIQRNGKPYPSTESSTSPKPSSSEREQGAFQLSLSEEKARRLRQVASHLELPPELVAERAIDMICTEAGTPQEDPPTKERFLSTGTLLYQNQARTDLFSARNGSDGSSPGQNDRNESGSLEDDRRGDGKGGDALPGPDATLSGFARS